jgi:hypothetical protein
MSPPENTARKPLGKAELQKLADKVYQLMQADVRLEQARGARTARRKEK